MYLENKKVSVLSLQLELSRNTYNVTWYVTAMTHMIEKCFTANFPVVNFLLMNENLFIFLKLSNYILQKCQNSLLDLYLLFTILNFLVTGKNSSLRLYRGTLMEHWGAEIGKPSNSSDRAYHNLKVQNIYFPKFAFLKTVKRKKNQAEGLPRKNTFRHPC